MSIVKFIAADVFIEARAQHLDISDKFAAPKNAHIMKLSTTNELAPQNEKYYYVRLAAIFRRAYIFQSVGVGQLAGVFSVGGRANRNLLKSNHTHSGARGIIRYALQQLEAAKFIAPKKGKTGRYITDAGRRELDTIARSLRK